MIQNLFHLSLSPGEFIVRGVSVFLFVLLLLRISGKRQLAQLSPIEFVAILLISNAVQNSMNGGDNSLLGGLILAATLILLSFVISYLTFRFKSFRLFFEGSPTMLIHNGKPIEKNLWRERMPHSELTTLLRKQGVHSYKEVQTAVLESDGTVSVTRTNDTPLPPRH